MTRWAPLGDGSQATSGIDAPDRLADLQRGGLTSHRLVPRRPSAGARDGSNPTVDSHQTSLGGVRGGRSRAPSNGSLTPAHFPADRGKGEGNVVRQRRYGAATGAGRERGEAW